MDLMPKYDDKKPWWQNIGSEMVFHLDPRMHNVVGRLHRIDAMEYRKYAVVHIGDGIFHSVNIDHIVKVEPIKAPKEN